MTFACPYGFNLLRPIFVIVTNITIVLGSNVVALQSDQLEHSDFLSQGVTAVVHRFTVHALDPRAEKESILQTVMLIGGGGGHVATSICQDWT